MSDQPEEPTYEEARAELDDVVRTLERGGSTLAESLALWERGEHLAQICQQALEGARARLDSALGSTGQPPSGEPSDSPVE